MKRIIISITAIAAIGAAGYLLGYSKAKKEAFWTDFTNSLGLAQILRAEGGLSEKGKQNLNEISDIWIYGYFLADHSTIPEKNKAYIEDRVIDLIKWKHESGLPVGPDKPMSSMALNKEEGEIEFTERSEEFERYRKALSDFLEKHEIKI